MSELPCPAPHSGGPQILGVLEVMSAMGLMTVTIMLSWILKLRMEKLMLLGSVRTVVQLLLLGYVLKPVFDMRNVYMVILLNVAMMMIASREANLRPTFYYDGMFFHAFGSILVSTFVSTAFGVTFVIKAQPWYDPRYTVPMIGMLLGNILSRISVGLDRTVTELSQNASKVEVLLSAGATKWEATMPIIREAVKTSLIPTINTMMVIGLVSVPGMMTGHIMGGTDPAVAARYQIVIVFLMCSTSTFGLISAIFLCINAMFDDQHRLLSRVLLKKRHSATIDPVSALFKWTVKLYTSHIFPAWQRWRGYRPHSYELVDPGRVYEDGL